MLYSCWCIPDALQQLRRILPTSRSSAARPAYLGFDLSHDLVCVFIRSLGQIVLFF